MTKSPRSWDKFVFQKVVDYEEKESRTRSSSVDAEIFFDLCNDIREMLKEIYTSKAFDVSTKIQGLFDNK